MPTTWTPETRPTTAWTLETKPVTTWNKHAPIGGFGDNPFGDTPKELAIELRGFGDPTTKWTGISG